MLIDSFIIIQNTFLLINAGWDAQSSFSSNLSVKRFKIWDFGN